MNLREKIINEFGGLSPELQRAAEFSLQNASQLVVLSMRAFAAEAGVNRRRCCVWRSDWATAAGAS